MMIHLIRHAESLPRINLTHEEGCSIGLSPFGEHQACSLAKKIKRMRVTKIYSSPIERAKQTAAIIGKYTSLPVTFDDRFCEFVVSRTIEEKKKFREVRKRARREHDYVPPNGESFNQSVARFESALHEIVSEDESDICIIAHELIIQNILITLFGLQKPPPIAHASLTTLELKNGSFFLVSVNRRFFSFLDISRKIRHKLTILFK